MAAQLKIAVVGAGGVGTALGKMASRKHLVRYGVRDPAKYASLAGLPNTSVNTVSEAVSGADLVVLATSGGYYALCTPGPDPVLPNCRNPHARTRAQCAHTRVRTPTCSGGIPPNTRSRA